MRFRDTTRAALFLTLVLAAIVLMPSCGQRSASMPATGGITEPFLKETIEPNVRPAPTATPTRTPVPTPKVIPTSLPEAILLEPMNYRQQTANNCGPASIAILLGYYDHWVTQQEVNEHVPPGCLSCDIVGYVSRYQLMARAYAYASPPTLDPARQLLANRVPVIAKQTLTPDIETRHFRVIRGYDDTFRIFISDDPLQGSGLPIAYDAFVEISNHGVLIPVYPPEKDQLVRSLMESLGMNEQDCRRTRPVPY